MEQPSIVSHKKCQLLKILPDQIPQSKRTEKTTDRITEHNKQPIKFERSHIFVTCSSSHEPTNHIYDHQM